MRHGSRVVLPLITAGLAPLLVASTLPAQATFDVKVTVTDMHSAKGQVLACLVSQAKAFPDCTKDPQARKAAVPAHGPVVIDFGPVPAGTYAVSLVHDENSNGKMDKHLFLPAEGYGFSRDAPVRMGPPSFASAAFHVDGGPAMQTVKMRYMF